MRTGRPPVVRVTVACESCGATLVRRASDASRNKTRRYFCNATCLRAVGCKPRRGEQHTCEQPGCGVSFYRGPNTPQRFCSRSCTDQWQARNAIERTCAKCGRVYPIMPSAWICAKRGYCSRRCQGDARIARPLDRSHNGRCARLDSSGYVMIYEPEHPKAIGGGWIFEHRHVVEQRLGRYLRTDETVHHRNEIKADNRSENLEVVSRADHTRYHARERVAEARANAARVADIERRVKDLKALARYWQRIATLKPDPMLYASIRLIEGDLLRRSGAAREVLH